MISRIRSRTGAFHYIDDATRTRIMDVEHIERLAKIGVPPAYNNVKIIKDPSSNVLAFGRDSMGRKQTIYKEEFVTSQRLKRLELLANFETTLGAIKRNVALRLNNPNTSVKDKCIAVIVRLMLVCHFRIGTLENIEKYNTYGLTTLLGKHVSVRGDTVHFQFMGKKSVPQVGMCKDAKVASFIANLRSRRLSLRPLFVYTGSNGVCRNVDALQVNQYLKSFDPNITSKSIRTYEANRLFMEFVKKGARQKRPVSDGDWKKVISDAVVGVAKELHNTPAVARKDYIDPRHIARLETDVTFRKRFIRN